MQALPSIKPIILSTFAVAEEIIQIKIPKFQVVNVVTGVGKAQAAHVLTKSIAEWQPCCVLNIGTAGTQRVLGGCSSQVIIRLRHEDSHQG